jgi:hypothetical protein
MPVVPILTYGRPLADLGRVEPPYRGFDGEWAELLDVLANDRDASLAGSYWSVGVARFLGDGDRRHLSDFERERVAGYRLVTDPDLVERFYADYGHIDFQEYYQR